LPLRSDFDLDGLDLPDGVWEELFAIDPVAWLQESDQTQALFDRIGGTVPQSLRSELTQLRWNLMSRL
jgi:phosphoenolpyruvate carboxykinase (GTP)